MGNKRKHDKILSEAEVAKRLGVSERLVRAMRESGEGPRHVVAIMTGKPCYRLSDVLEFEDGGLLKLEDLARRWGITIRAVQQRDCERKIPGRVKLGKLYVRFRLNQIVAYENATRSPD